MEQQRKIHTFWIDLKQTLEVSAIRYYANSNEMTDYSIEVSEDGNEYIGVAEGIFDMESGQNTVYFTNGTDPWVTTYDIRYIKVTAKRSGRTRYRD